METVNDFKFEETMTYSTTFSTVTCNIYFPEENPKHTLDNLTDALAHLGAFEGITNEEISSK